MIFIITASPVVMKNEKIVRYGGAHISSQPLGGSGEWTSVTLTSKYSQFQASQGFKVISLSEKERVRGE